jgi:HSP20 family molecular chaperone IbpA
MSAKWRRACKNRKWLDFNDLKNKKVKSTQKTQRLKTMPSHQSFRSPKRYAKRNILEDKPLIDIFQENGYITIVAEIVGFNRETLKINVKDQKITLSAKSKERRYYKSLNLPTVVIPDATHTKFKNGVLEVKLKKAQTLDKEAD